MTAQVSNEAHLNGMVGLVAGVAHVTSIGWAIAQRLSAAGMRLAFTSHPDRINRVRQLTDTIDGALLIACDVQDDAQLDDAFAQITEHFGRLDTFVHSIAFAKQDDLQSDFSATSRDGYLLAQDISSYSLTAMTKRAVPLFDKAGGGSVITLSYIGGERVMQGYNVMGVAKASLEMSMRYLAAELGAKNIRVNAISAGPIKTLAARGVSGFSTVLNRMPSLAPLKRNVTADEVANTALFLAGPLSSGITGEVIHVDAGYHIAGIMEP